MHIKRAFQTNSVECILMTFLVFMLVFSIHIAIKEDGNNECPVDAVPIQDKSN